MLIGRENEIATLHGLMSSDESQFVAVYGRRRVGKTFLIREVYKTHFVFQHTGTYGATRRQQLSDFRESLYLAGMGKCAMPKTWSEAFGLLWNFLNTFPENEEKKVIFIDELPWMDKLRPFTRPFLERMGFYEKRPYPGHLRKRHIMDHRQCGHELWWPSQPSYMQGSAATIHPQRVQAVLRSEESGL